MAEEQDPFLHMQEVVGDLMGVEPMQQDPEPPAEQQQDVKPVVVENCDNISLGEFNEQQQQKDVETVVEAAAAEKKQAEGGGQEETVESPTTAEETFVFKCIFCDQVLSGKDEPKILECLHNACGNCVQQKLYEQNDEGNIQPGIAKGIECTFCGYFMNTASLLDNQFLIELSGGEEVSNKLAELKCSSCSDDAPATSWCSDCAEFICDSCVQAHQRLKITKDHTIKSKEEGVTESQTFAGNAGPTQLLCLLHPQEKLSLFCEHCDKLTCRDCQLIEHRDHKYKFTHEIASDCRKLIHTMLKDISYKRVLLNSAMKVIDDRQALINEKKQALVQEITSLVVRLTNTINVRGKQLVARLNEVCDSKQKTLDEKKVALNHLSKITDHCIQFTKNVLDNGSDNALLYSKKHLTTHLQRVKSRRADIPNPEIPVRIHLALDKVPDLIKGLNGVISTIGQIIVDGRAYPSQTPSPSTLPPQSSPSPGHQAVIPNQQPQPQQQQQVQQQQQQQQQSQQPQQQQQQQGVPPPYGQQARIMAPYQYQANMQQNMMPGMNQMQQQMAPMPPQTMTAHGMQSGGQMQQQNTGMMTMAQGMGPNIRGLSPITLAQQMNSGMQQNSLARIHMRPGMRPILPRQRMHNPGMNSQQQVTSSTHPQGMMQDHSNLRGLLQPNTNAVYVQTGPGQYQAVQPQYAQQFQTRFQGPQQQQQQYRQPMQQQQQQQRLPALVPRQQVAGFQSPPLRQPSAMRWHTPQQQHGGGDGSGGTGAQVKGGIVMPTLNNNFKIMLKSQQNVESKTTVTSTIPKTPSPNHLLQGAAEKSLDKFCEDSVNDLMATIAKLDSNGVQVLAESRPKTGGSPHVDSSTGDNISTKKDEVMEMGKDDPNEDWCAVCMDGGELVCCDKCPKVFHQFCHIPNLSVEESDTWQCLLCMNFADVSDTNEPGDTGLTSRQKKIAERLVLELYCQYEPSLPFREVVGPENTDYHEMIKNPIALDTIRHKLDWNSSTKYTSLEHLVRDVRQMFKNAYMFNSVDSQVYADAKTLEKFFDEQLEKWLPEYAYETFEEDESIQPPSKKYRRIIGDDE